MIVEHILSEKGHGVVTVDPKQTLMETARLLDEKRIGAIVVRDADHPVLGIISERDIARALAQQGTAALDEPVSQHMTAKLFTCTRSSTTGDLMRLMTERRVRHVPVIERGQLAGIISIGDIVKQRLAELETERHALHDYSAGVSTPGQKF